MQEKTTLLYYSERRKFKMKTIFITGASSGIGKETTKFFSNKG